MIQGMPVGDTVGLTVKIENLVLVDQLLGRGDSLGRRAGRILRDHYELTAMNTALIVDVLKVGHEADLGLTIAGRVACEGPHDTDLDGGIR